MTKIAKLKLRDFARRHGLTDAQRARLAASLDNASAAQTEVILQQAGNLLSRAVVRIGPPKPSLIAPPTSLLVDSNGRVLA